MIDARLWTRPSASEVRDMIHSLRNGRTLKDTAAEIGARLGKSRRTVFYWMSEDPASTREITYCEWLALRELVNDGWRKGNRNG